MRKRLWLAATLLLGGALLAWAVQSGSPPARSAAPASEFAPGRELAEALSTVTGVAISPLLGTAAVGAWKYFRTPAEGRPRLPWYAQPYFWVPALLIVAAVFAKDALGPALPTALKKPFDVLEVFENKASGLIAAGLFVPLVASVFGSGASQTSLSQAAGLAAFDPGVLLNLLTVPVALAVFVIVWLVSHVINVLILISPFGTVDAVLKAARLALLATVPLTTLANPYLGAVWSLVIIVACYFLSGWAFRLMVFGTVFAWDCLTLRWRRFKPSQQPDRAFLARELDRAPVRTCGRLSRDKQGQLVFGFRPWLVLPRRTLGLPEGQYAVGRGLFYPELVRIEGDSVRAQLTFPPRYRSHEEEVTRIYGLEAVRDVGVRRGLKAVWRWLKGRPSVEGAPVVVTT
jgi:MFS family permease